MSSPFKKDEKGDYTICDECGDLVRTGRFCKCGSTGLFSPPVTTISEEIG